MTKKLFGFLVGIFALTLMFAGGYFVYVSAIITLPLLAMLFWHCCKEKHIKLSWDINMLAISMVVFMYLPVSLWAADSGMAIMGFFKFIPVLLFLILVHQVADEQREKMIQMLPTMGSLMTLFSALMMQFKIFEGYVTVAGRLAGFFQYPNTYAAFMLVCFVISVYQFDWKKPDWLVVLNTIVALVGIYLSGSRAVFIIAAVVILYMIFANKQIRKFMIPCIGVGVVAAVIWSVVGNGMDVLSRLSGNLLHSSTFLGRFLYYIDALPVILRNPFGLGYYGYYSVQQEIQTGVYSVLNIHNELLQFMLDVGIIPAILLYFCLVKQMIGKGRSVRDRVVFFVLLAHSLFDYDFQFIAMLFVVLLFIRVDKTREICFKKQHSLVIAGMISALVMVGGCFVGLSEHFYTQGENETALAMYSGNTAAKIAMLTEVETAEEMLELADDILESNPHNALAYSAKARVAFSEGKVEQFIQYKLQAMKLAPYQYQEYVDYVEALLWAYTQYAKAGDTDSAGMCLKRVEAVYDMLEEVKEKTHPLAWEIDDLPQLELPTEYAQALENAQKQLSK